MKDAEKDVVKHAAPLLRDLAARIEAAPSAAEAEAILREATGSVDRMRERMYRTHLTADPFDVIREAGEAKRQGRTEL